MTTYGVTPEGFVKKSLEVIKAELEDAYRAAFGAGINLLATSTFGQEIGIKAAKLAELWDVAEDAYNSLYPDSAAGSALDNVMSITGVVRLAAEQSVAEVICTGTAGTALLVGRVLSVTGAGDRFASTAAATLAAATAWAPTTAYVLGDVRTNAGNIYVVTVAGTSAGAGGPTSTGTAIVDNTVTWRFVGTGTAFALVSFSSEEYGPINASAFTLTTIETPVAGWSGAANRLDATLGNNQETDAAARVRREQLLRVTGNATLEAIRAKILSLGGAHEVYIFENTTLVTDPSGLPPKSFEAVVDNSTDAAVAQAIFDSKPVGIETYGSVTQVVTDSQGFNHTIKFSRPTQVVLYIAITITTDPATFPLDGVAQVKTALVNKGHLLGIGDDVIMLSLKCAALDVAGVIDVTVFKVDTVDPPINTSNILVDFRSIAAFDTSRVAVTVV